MADPINPLPPPPVGACVDLKDFPFFPLDVLRLRDSDLAIKAKAEEFRAAILLWCVAWHQVPASSLPEDDEVLASYAGFGRAPKEWKKIRAGALRGWTMHADGRLYHAVLAEKATEAWEGKLKRRHLRECDRLKKAAQRAGVSPSYPTFDEWKLHVLTTGSDRWESNGEDVPNVSLGTNEGQGEDVPNDVHGDSHPLKGQGIGTVDRDRGEGQGEETEAKQGRTESDPPSADDDSDSTAPKRGAVTIDTWIASLAGADAVPATDSVFTYATDAGIPHAFLELSWLVFADRARASKKRQRDWRQTYRNYVQGNYLHLWWINGEGEYQLTTQGIQAQRVIEAKKAEAA